MCFTPFHFSHLILPPLVHHMPKSSSLYHRKNHVEGSCASICSTVEDKFLPGSPYPSRQVVCSGQKTKKIMYDMTENDDFDREMIATYDEVAKLYPRPGNYRPVVLIGAPGVGRNELKRRLTARDPEKYRSPVPCE